MRSSSAKSSPLAALDINQLFLVLQAENLAALEASFSSVPQISQWVQKRKNFCQDLDESAISDGIYAAIETASSPIDLFWALISLVGLGVAAVPLSLTFLGLSAFLGGFYFYNGYKKSKITREADNNYFCLADLQLQACEIIQAHYKKLLGQPSAPAEKVDFNFSRFAVSSVSKAQSVGITLATTGIIFASYYWGVSSILQILGLITVSSALMGPVGVAIAASLAIGIGLFLGYRHYQAKKSAEMIEREKINIGRKLSTARDSCFELKGKVTPAFATSRLGVFPAKKQYSQDDMLYGNALLDNKPFESRVLSSS